jgi:hypothetical protein
VLSASGTISRNSFRRIVRLIVLSFAIAMALLLSKLRFGD